MRILFASMPMDGHFNPLTGLAVHLRKRGHDVRWYTAQSYAAKLAALEVPHFPFVRARDINGETRSSRGIAIGRTGAHSQRQEDRLERRRTRHHDPSV